MNAILVVYVAMSVVTFFAYGLDKRAAVRGRTRTRERTLHLLEALGGFPGALAGQAVFRHKRRKLSYMVVFWLIVVGHVAAWAAWFVLRR